MIVTTNKLLEMIELTKSAPYFGDVSELLPAENLYFQYLWVLTKTLKPALTVEYGTWKGLSALHLAEGNPEGRIISIDDLSLAKRFERENTLEEEYKRPNITYLIQDCITPNDYENINLLFIDGNHGENVEIEYDFWLPKMASNAIILFDDINFNERIKKFWREFNPNGERSKIKGDKIDLSMLHTWSNIGFGAVVLKPFEGEKEGI